MKTIEYYLMRHASYYDFQNQYINYYGMIALKHSMDNLKAELEEKFPQKKLRIIHSVLPRAKHTALLMEDILQNVIKVFLRMDPRLNSDKLMICEDYVREVVDSCEMDDEICLILSHQPDIKHFCKIELETSHYIRRSIEIDEKFTKAVEESDDLPF